MRGPSVAPATPLRDNRPAASDRNAIATDTHRAQPGDTFASLAKNYYGNERFARFLKESNPQFASSDSLTPGTVIRIPATPKDVTSEPSTGVKGGDKLASEMKPSSSTAAPATKTSGSGKTYQVRTGDSFYSIARGTFGDSKRWKEIYELNRKVVKNDPKNLRPGQVLTLPER